MQQFINQRIFLRETGVPVTLKPFKRVSYFMHYSLFKQTVQEHLLET